jgi:hypothetical protein
LRLQTTGLVILLCALSTLNHLAICQATSDSASRGGAGQTTPSHSAIAVSPNPLLQQADDLDKQADNAAAKAASLEQQAARRGILGAASAIRAKQFRNKEHQLREQAQDLRAQTGRAAQSSGDRNQAAAQTSGADGNLATTSSEPSGLAQKLDMQWCSASYPQDWRANQTPSAVVLSPDPQPVDYTRMHPVPPRYGAVIKVVHLPGLHNNLNEANFQKLLESLQKAGEGWGGPLSYSVSMTVNGRPARAAEISRSYLDRNKEVKQRGWIVAITPPGVGLGTGDYFIFYAVFLAPEEDFHARRPLFEKIAQSITVKEIHDPRSWTR